VARFLDHGAEGNSVFA